MDACKEKPANIRKLEDYLDRNGHHLRIRIRTSCLGDETSYRHWGGSKYTQSLIGRMVHEGVRASASGNNWGLDFARNHNVNASDVAFGASRSYEQTDLPVDFDYTRNGGWRWHYPQDREHLLRNTQR